MTEQPYKKLLAWEAADRFVVAVYQATANFPEEEKFGLTSQLRRAASSIALNIVEGQARATRPDFVRFLVISRGSAAECAYLLELSTKLGYLSKEKYAILEQLRGRTGFLLRRMIEALK
ncbi:four helix bundle protein [Patescibacteria group bacterium]|nr:MAG: four helix bundle protein [Patescibacteria group bacterium]